MTQLMHNELEKLKKQLLALTAVVEEAVQHAVQSLLRIDTAMAHKVVSIDDSINEAEVDLEEECLKVLALHQPVATDLRYIVAVLKINNDLERIGDLAANIAERTLTLAETPRSPAPFDIAAMADKTLVMLKQALDCLVQLDTRLARKVLKLDDEVDALHASNYKHFKDAARQHPEQLEALTNYLTVSRHLERIADLATNIAEDVYYMIEGEIVRHSSDWAKG